VAEGEAALRSALEACPGVARLVLRPSTGSTNDDLIALAESEAPTGTVVLADEQTGGRGRLDRTWHSPPLLGLYVSVLFRPERPADELPRWTFAAAVAAGESCRELVGEAVVLKWPNDVLARGRKLAGVLAEARSTAGRAAWLVVGTGINVNQERADFPGGLASLAVSLRELRGGGRIDRVALARAYLERLFAWSAQLDQGRFDGVATAWERLSPHAQGATVRSVAGAAPFQGVTRGLDGSGALLVETAEGKLLPVRQGESLDFGEGS